MCEEAEWFLVKLVADPDDESSIHWPIGPGPIIFWRLVWPKASEELLKEHPQALLRWTHNFMCDQIIAMTALGGVLGIIRLE